MPAPAAPRRARRQPSWGERLLKDGSRRFWTWDPDGRHASLYLQLADGSWQAPGYSVFQSWDLCPPTYRRITRRQAKGALKIPTLRPYLHQPEQNRDRCARCHIDGRLMRDTSCLVPHR